MQAQPWTTYIGDRYLADGIGSIGDAVARARQQQMQQQNFQADLAERQRAHDLGYYGDESNRAATYYGIDTRANQAAAEMTQRSEEEGAKMRERSDPRRVQPVSLMDPATGQPMPNLYGIPMTGQVLQPKGAAAQIQPNSNAAVPVTDPSGKVLGHKVILNGKETFVKPPSNGLDMGEDLPKNPGGNNGNQLMPAMPKAQSKAEYDALPVGSKFIGPDGNVWVKR